MFINRDTAPGDLPVPPTPDEVARDFGAPLLTLAEQDSIEEADIGVGSQSLNGRLMMTAATISYTLWRHPDDRGDPANLAELTEDIRLALDAPPARALPGWLLEARERMRYPSLWEAVRTTRLGDRSAAWFDPDQALVEHVNYVVMNTFREERVRGALPGELLGEVTEKAVEHDIPILIDGVEVPGLRIDTDPHVLGLGADLDDRMLTVAIARDHLPFLRLAFVTRANPA